MKIKEVITNVQFYKIRDRRNLTATNILPLIESNNELQQIFQMSDPEKIANTFTKELETIIEYLAPSRRIQRNNKNKQKLKQDTIAAIVEADSALTLATNTLSTEDFRNAKHLQNVAAKKIEIDKTEEIKRKL